MVFGLIGNQNCGKTTLFNQLTGSNQHVGNFPGVTVDKKEGTIRRHPDATVVDLPGIYSLSPYTSEEIVTRDFLINERPDGVINIVDATNLERNLYLTLQVMELGIPMVVALNMMDEVRTSGTFIDIPKMAEMLGIPFVPISASRNEGVDELCAIALETARNKTFPAHLDFCHGPIHRAIHSIGHMIEDHAQALGVPKRFAATKLIEGDDLMIQKLSVSKNDLEGIGHIVDEMEQTLGTDREAALADMRYSYIEGLCQKCVVKKGETREAIRSEKMDRVLTNKYLAIPIFLVVMMLIFWLTFGVIGKLLSDWLALGIDTVTALTDSALTSAGVSATLHSLIIDGVFAGVGSVLSFLPIIVVLFFFLSVLEDSGYMNTLLPGYLIRQKRTEKGWSQSGLCRGICAVSYLSKIEQGKAEPSGEILRLLLARLNVPWHDEAEAAGVSALVEQGYEAVFSCDDASHAAVQKRLSEQRELCENGLFRLDALLLFCFSAGRQEDSLREFESLFSVRQKTLWLLAGGGFDEALQFNPAPLTFFEAGKDEYAHGDYARAQEHLQHGYELASREGLALLMLLCSLLLATAAAISWIIPVCAVITKPPAGWPKPWVTPPRCAISNTTSPRRDCRSAARRKRMTFFPARSILP